MHVAYNGWFWNQPHTGSGQYVRRLLHGLRRTAPELQMTLIAPARHAPPDDVPDDVQVMAVEGFGGSLGKVWFEQRGFPQAAGRAGADIAHVPYWGPPLSSPVRLVTSILDVIPLMLPEYAPGIRGRLYTALVSVAARGAAHIITLSTDSKAEIVARLGLPAGNVTPTHLAADERFHPRMGAERDEAVRAKYNLPPRFVLYMGGFDTRKQVGQLLLAYTYIGAGADIPLVMAGREPKWGARLFPDMRKYADALNIGEFIRWVGYVDEADKPSLYRLAEGFVWPSRYEGFGLPVLEALASGTPVVANEIPVMEEVAGDGAYLVEAGDARAMAGAILALINQKPFRDTMVNQGLSRATRFSWRKTAQQTLAVYERVMT